MVSRKKRQIHYFVNAHRAKYHNLGHKSHADSNFYSSSLPIRHLRRLILARLRSFYRQHARYAAPNVSG